MDARAGTFHAFSLFGEQLLQSGHFASPEVQEKLDAMAEARQELERWVLGIWILGEVGEQILGKER